MPSAADQLRAAAASAGGALPFDRFMELALYGPSGFYTSGGSAGRRGDFITSPEVGPLFGEVLARAIEAEWHRLGRPDDFTVIEVGAGQGTLARSLLPALQALRRTGSERLGCGASRSPRYVAVEVSAGQRARHPDGVEPADELPRGPVVGVVLANELLDNLPFRLAVFDGAWREAFVVPSPDGTWSEVLSAPIEPLPGWLPAHPPHGARVPLQDRAAAWVDRARRLLGAGRVIAIDYCTARTAELATIPWRSWLRTYRGHERGEHYLRNPGTQDITAQVCLDQLPAADEIRSQAQFLHRWGIEELVEAGRQAWEAARARPDLTAIRMRSRITEAEALVDPAGLGGFDVLEWRV